MCGSFHGYALSCRGAHLLKSGGLLISSSAARKSQSSLTGASGTGVGCTMRPEDERGLLGQEDKEQPIPRSAHDGLAQDGQCCGPGLTRNRSWPLIGLWKWFKPRTERRSFPLTYGPAPDYRLRSDRGRSNHGITLFSKRVMAEIRSPLSVST